MVFLKNKIIKMLGSVIKSIGNLKKIEKINILILQF